MLINMDYGYWFSDITDILIRVIILVYNHFNYSLGLNLWFSKFMVFYTRYLRMNEKVTEGYGYGDVS